MEDLYLPNELTNLFIKTYKGQYYKGWWEIVDKTMNVCDQYDDIPHLHNDRLTIILHSYYSNSKTIYHFFKIEENKVKLEIFATTDRGAYFSFDEPPYCKSKIMKVKKYLENKIQGV